MFKLETNSKRRNGVSVQQFPKYGKTIATLSGAGDNALNIIQKIVSKSQNTFNWFAVENIDKLQLRNQYKGVCKVNEKDGDIFNAEYGVDLARAKCMNRYHRDLDPILRKYLAEARRLVAGFEHYMYVHNIDFENVKSVDDMRLYDFGENMMHPWDVTKENAE